MTQTATWTVKEYYKALAEGRLNNELYYEILDGELIVMPSPKFVHQNISANLNDRLRYFVREHELGIVIYAPMDVILSELQKPQPDIIFVSKARMGIIRKNGYVHGAPDLVVEILSPSTAQKDRLDKRRIYAQAGVAEYWLINSYTQTVQVLRLEDGEYVEVAQPEGQLVGAGSLKGFEVELNEIFALPDGLGPDDPDSDDLVEKEELGQN